MTSAQLSTQTQEFQDHLQDHLIDVGRMSATIVHEVRNALTTILMGLHAMQSLELSELNERRLELSLAEAERTQRLLNQLLHYASPAKKELSDIELNTFLQEIVDSQQMVYAAQTHPIRFLASPNPLPIRVETDRLQQAFINLIANACEASSNMQVITCQVQESINSGMIEIAIHNWGSPIAADLLPQVAQPFMTTKPHGNGLGLFVVSQFIQEQGGQLTIQSSLEAGTTVSMTLIR